MNKTLWHIISFIGLGLTIIPSVLVFIGVLEMSMNKSLMAVGCLLWFAGAPQWMKIKA